MVFQVDDQTLDFFKRNFNNTHYKNLRSTYLALCELNKEDGHIWNFTKTVAAYAGTHPDTIRPYLHALQKSGIINYRQLNEGGAFGATTLSIFRWDGEEEKTAKLIYRHLPENKNRKANIDAYRETTS